MATNQGFKSMIPRDNRVTAGYLAHWLRAHKAQLQGLGTGATFQEISKAVVERISVPLPPLTEQRRIAAILDHADALRAKRRQSLSLLSDLTTSTYLSMFGDPERASDETTLGRVAQLTGGRNLVSEDPTAKTLYRVLKISAVTSGVFRPEESKPLPLDYVPPDTHLVRRGDLLMSRANTAELVGATAYVPSAPVNLVLPDKIWRFDWYDSKSVPVFYHAMLQTPALRRRISALSSGSSGSMKNVSKANLDQLRLPAVTTEAQERFAARVESIERNRLLASHSLQGVETLLNSLSTRAFNGSL